MHVQDLFREQRPDELHRLIRAYPLGLVIVPAAPRIEANLVPLEVLDIGPLGQLRGHVARSHSLAGLAPERLATLTVFQSPNAYISPRWYVAGQRSGRLAPSWNYITVQAHGTLRFIDDPEWMLAHLRSLAKAQEADRPDGWNVDAAPPEFLAEMSARLIGFEIDITQLDGKRFLSQQRTPADRESIVRHLEASDDGPARALAALITP